MSDKVKLKACPFCGAPASEPEKVGRPGGRPLWKVGCSCFCVSQTWGTKKEAVKYWNTRLQTLAGATEVVEGLGMLVVPRLELPKHYGPCANKDHECSPGCKKSTCPSYEEESE